MLLDNTGLCALFKQQMPNSDRMVVETYCRRCWDTTHTFHLPTCELGFTPLDFTMLTGTRPTDLFFFFAQHIFVIYYIKNNIFMYAKLIDVV